MSTFGRELLPSLTTGHILQVTSDGNPEHKTGGLTIDWSTVAPVTGAPLSLPDGNTVPVGDAFLRYGQVLTKITATGKYGPYDPAAQDGRQNLNRGETFIVNITTWRDPASGIGKTSSDHPHVIMGGRMWRDRIIATAGAASLAAGPTWATLEAALPRMIYTEITN